MIAKHVLRGARWPVSLPNGDEASPTAFETTSISCVRSFAERVFTSRDTPTDENSSSVSQMLTTIWCWATRGEAPRRQLRVRVGPRSEGPGRDLARHMASIGSTPGGQGRPKGGQIPEHVDPHRWPAHTGWAFAGDVSHLWVLKKVPGPRHLGPLARRHLQQFRGGSLGLIRLTPQTASTIICGRVLEARLEAV